MSDETEVPNTPPVEEVPLPPEPPEEPAADVEDEGTGKETEEGSEDATAAGEGQEEAAPADPVVETTPTGQTVTFPDGRVVHTRSSDAPVSNAEWQAYELTHQGDQLRYPYVPGDQGYTPYSDPSVPDSRLAQQIEREIGSFAERVLKDPAAEISYLWNALQGNHQGELDRAIATGGGSDKVMA